MTLREFRDKWLGKKADFDGFYGGQCVDLYRFYVKEVLGFPQSPGVGGAAEIWDSASPEYYDFITNTPSGVPEPGDIVIWNRRAGGGFGHVAIFLHGDVNSFTSLDQNWPTLDKVTETQHNYTNVIGWLRPKGNMSDEYGDMVYKATQHDETVKYIWSDKDPRQTTSLEIQQHIAGLKSQATTLRNDLAKAQAEVASLNETISTLSERITQKDNEIKELHIATNNITKELNDLRVSSESRVKVLEGSVDQCLLEKKGLLSSHAVLESQLAECRKGLPNTSCFETFISNIRKLFGS
jgi:archaellum component FlaC